MIVAGRPPVSLGGTEEAEMTITEFWEKAEQIFKQCHTRVGQFVTNGRRVILHPLLVKHCPNCGQKIDDKETQ